ncbi:DUF433 domain-containing protein [candidate division KSB1 bacterium]|nr:DUF433 domain-containing protein [candidate division KSB1 bacterium]
MKRSEIGKHLVVDPKVCHGKLTFKGTRVPVSTVLTFLSMGDSIDSILRNWPELSREAVEEAIRWTADLIHEKYKTKTARMGKVARVNSARIEYMQVKDETVHALKWPGPRRNR